MIRAHLLPLLALLLVGSFQLAHAAVMYPPQDPNNRNPPPEKPTLVATVFEVLITDEKGGTQRDRFIFDDTRLACSFLTKAGLGKIPYEEKPGKEIADPIPWTAVYTDAQGDKVAFNGEAVKDAMTGTITVTPKLGSAHLFKFTGGKAGTGAARKATAGN